MAFYWITGGQANKIVDALSRRHLVVQEGKIQVLGFKFMKQLYEQDSDFQEAFEACKSTCIMIEVSGKKYDSRWFVI